MLGRCCSTADQEQRQKCKEKVDQRYQAGAAGREGNIPWMSLPKPRNPERLWQDTRWRQHEHSRQLPPEAARWLRNISACSCLHSTQPRDSARDRMWEPQARRAPVTLGSTRGTEHPYLQDQGKEAAGCFSHLEKVERLCESETRRGLAKPVVQSI